jgi:hypothetical protein
MLDFGGISLRSETFANIQHLKSNIWFSDAVERLPGLFQAGRIEAVTFVPEDSYCAPPFTLRHS